MIEIKEILDVLPEPFRDKAITNCKSVCDYDRLRYAESSHAINIGFTWDQTTEGHGYWHSLHYLAEKKVKYAKT